MPSSLFQHRLILIVPVAKVSAVTTWMQANLDPQCVPADLGPGLNATGLDTDPITHNWCCTALTDPQCKALLAKMCQLCSITPPTNAQWNSWTRQEKIDWLHSVQASMRTNYGIWVTLCGNDAAWDSSDAALTTMGLQTIAPASP